MPLTKEQTTHDIVKLQSIIDKVGLKQLTSDLKELKDIKMIMSALDEEEQRAKIAALNKQAESDNVDHDISIHMCDMSDEFTK